MPRLIVHATTNQTVNAVQALHASSGGRSMSRGRRVDLRQCCAVVDREAGVHALEGLVELTGSQLKVVCSAVLHDDLFRQVRVWARMGYSAESIQAELDRKFGEYYRDPNHTVR